jgi:hypothetical protein
VGLEIPIISHSVLTGAFSAHKDQSAIYVFQHPTLLGKFKQTTPKSHRILSGDKS